MKHNPKSAFIKILSLAACLAILGACDKVNWPHVYGPDEVPQSVRDAPRPIESPPPAGPDAPFPRLGDVPSHPKNFTPPAEIDKTKQQMDEDRDEAQRLREQTGEPSQ